MNLLIKLFLIYLIPNSIETYSDFDSFGNNFGGFGSNFDPNFSSNIQNSKTFNSKINPSLSSSFNLNTDNNLYSTPTFNLQNNVDFNKFNDSNDVINLNNSINNLQNDYFNSSINNLIDNFNKSGNLIYPNNYNSTNSSNYFLNNTLNNLINDNCIINPCINGFCLLNQSNPLGYNCFCKDGFTGYHCQIKYDECKPDYCKNGATCVQEDASLICFCKVGYKGKYCEELIDNCSSLPCLNGGICKNSVNDYECSCRLGFQGKNCEQDINLCTKETCKNNGTCIDGLGINYKCICLDGFEGTHCEKLIDKCKPNPCLNHGQCLSTKSGTDYVCNCPCEYTGKNCDSKVLFCKERDYCLNEGVCVVSEEEHLESNSSLVKYEKNQCYCKGHYYGDRCEFKYSKCLTSNIICENNGTCIDSIEPNIPFKCLCKDNYRGKYCEIDCHKTNDCITIDNSLNKLTPSLNFPNNDQSNTVNNFLTPTTEHQLFTNTDLFPAIISSNFITPTFSNDHQSSTINYPFNENFRPTDVSNTPNYQSFTNAPHFNITEEKKINRNRPPNFSPNTVNRSSEINPSIFDNPFNSILNPSDHHPNLFNETKIPSYQQLSPQTKRIFSPKFNGLSTNTSFLQFEKDKHEFAYSFMVHFDFSTNSLNGILFHTEAELNSIVFAIIYLENGLLKLSFSCNQQNTIYLISDEHHQLNDNQFNHVQMYFKLDLKKGVCESQIQLNNILSVNKNQTSSLPLNTRICFKYFDFGNKQSDNPYLPYNIPSFKGCLKNIYINNQLKLVKDALRAENLEECNLEKICELSPCGLNGECIKISNNKDKFENKYADIYKNGINNQFNDTIIKKDTNYISDNWICKCKPGYLGKFCEIASCEQNPCSNQSACVLISPSKLNCICPESKFSDYCDLDFKYDVPHFNKESYLVFPVQNKNNYIEILFNFTSSNLEQNNALLLYMEGSSKSHKYLRRDYFSLTLDKSLIFLKINLEYGTKEISAKLSDHQNLHQVRLGYSKQLFWLSVDNQKSEDQLYTVHNSLLVDGKLYVGGHQLINKIEQLMDVDFFEGCVFNVSIRTNQQNSTFILMNQILTNSNVNKCEESDCK